MRCKKKRNVVIVCIIIAMFFSGMCFDSIKASPSFGTSQNSLQSVLEISAKNKISQQDYCTVEQFGEITLRGTMELLRRDFSNRYAKNKSKNSGFIFVTNLLLENPLLYFMGEMLENARRIIRSENFIITYIHQQDGAKG